MRTAFLRKLLLLDAVVLFVLGAFLIFLPESIEQAFHFDNLPGGVSYIVGLWGCASMAMSLGYLAAARNPIRHIVWVQLGMARGAAELTFGLVCICRGVVTFPQSAFGTVIAGLMALGYAVFYPRKPRLLQGGVSSPPSVAPREQAEKPKAEAA